MKDKYVHSDCTYGQELWSVFIVAVFGLSGH